MYQVQSVNYVITNICALFFRVLCSVCYNYTFEKDSLTAFKSIPACFYNLGLKKTKPIHYILSVIKIYLNLVQCIVFIAKYDIN